MYFANQCECCKSINVPGLAWTRVGQKGFHAHLCESCQADAKESGVNQPRWTHFTLDPKVRALVDEVEAARK